jgi:RND family efflux transporter MFP subunit
MKRSWKLLVFVTCAASCLLILPQVFGQVFKDQSKPPLATTPAELAKPDADIAVSRPDTVTAVVYPFKSATVGSEVRGILDVINFKEGEPVKEGAVVAEVSKARYTAIVGEFHGNYEAVIRTLSRAREELAVQEELFEKRSNTLDDVQKARSQVTVLEARKEEAEFKLKQADLNLVACIIKAPFTGNIAVLYHEPFETVDNLEKVFGVIDTSKVYARANWPENRLSELAVGKKAVFRYGQNEFQGAIEKISSLIDPASKSKRVHVLIDNSDARLQVGMSGTLTLVDQKKVSMQTDTAAPE